MDVNQTFELLTVTKLHVALLSFVQATDDLLVSMSVFHRSELVV